MCRNLSACSPFWGVEQQKRRRLSKRQTKRGGAQGSKGGLSPFICDGDEASDKRREEERRGAKAPPFFFVCEAKRSTKKRGGHLAHRAATNGEQTRSEGDTA